MSDIQQTFEYDLPDEYLSQTNTLKLKGEYNYNGPEKIYVFCDKLNNKIKLDSSYRVHDDSVTQEELDNALDVLSGLDYYHAPIEFSSDPLLISAIVPEPVASDLPQKEYRLTPDSEVFYSRPDPTTPSHTIELSEVEYDPEKKEWKKPFSWKNPHITTEQFEYSYKNILATMEEVDTSSFTKTQKTKWNNYILEFKDVPNKFKDYWQSPWMIPFPSDPRWDENWSTKGNAGSSDEISPPTVTEIKEDPTELNTPIEDETDTGDVQNEPQVES
jgi:hypothetical protein